MTKAHMETRAQVRGAASVVAQDPAQVMAAAMVQDPMRTLAQVAVMVRAHRLEILAMVMVQVRIPIPAHGPVVVSAVLPVISGSNRLMVINRGRKAMPRPHKAMLRNQVRGAILRDRRLAHTAIRDTAIHSPAIGTTTIGGNKSGFNPMNMMKSPMNMFGGGKDRD